MNILKVLEIAFWILLVSFFSIGIVSLIEGDAIAFYTLCGTSLLIFSIYFYKKFIQK